MRKQIVIIFAIIYILTQFCGCKSDKISHKIFAANTDETYFTADYYTVFPSVLPTIQNTNIRFPIVSDSKIKKLESVIFSYDEHQLDEIEINSINLEKVLTYKYPEGLVKESEDYRYYININISIYNIINKIQIDKILFRLDKNDYEFKVDIEIISEDADISNPDVFISYAKNFFDNQLEISVSLYTYTIFDTAQLNDFEFTSIPLQPSEVQVSNDSEENYFDFNKGMIIEPNKEYYFRFIFDNYNLKNFYDEGIRFDVKINDSYETSWYSDIYDWKTTFLGLDDADKRFFNND